VGTQKGPQTDGKRGEKGKSHRLCGKESSLQSVKDDVQAARKEKRVASPKVSKLRNGNRVSPKRYEGRPGRFEEGKECGSARQKGDVGRGQFKKEEAE